MKTSILILFLLTSVICLSAEKKVNEVKSKTKVIKEVKTLEQQQVDIIRNVATKLFTDKSLSNN